MTTLALNRKFSPVTAGLSRPASGSEAILLWKIIEASLADFKYAGADRAYTRNELHAIEDENRDGDSSSPSTILGSTLILAERFLTALPSDLLQPEVTLEPDGDIAFEWYGVSGRNFSVSLRHDGRVAYAGAFGPEKTRYGTDRFDDEISKEIVEAVRDLGG